MAFLIYPCGCKFELQDSSLKDDIVVDDKLKEYPAIKLDFNNIDKDCKDTWNLISEGNTTGVFQVETRLGSIWCKKIQPHNIDELSLIIALIRPGCLESYMEDGKNLTHHCCERKHGREDVVYLNDTMKEILKDTYGILTYQEEAILLASKVAGMNLQQADSLRKAIGKKDTELMSKLEKEFVEGCKNTGVVTEEQGKEIFETIRASQRYQFNRCLALDTTVEVYKDYKYIIKPIKDIKIGDSLTCPGYYSDTKRSVSSDSIRWHELTNVVNIFDNGKQFISTISLSKIDDKSLRKEIDCTINHRFLCSDNVIRPVKNLDIGNILICKDGNYIIDSLWLDHTKAPTINIEVDHPRHLYYANGITTSNSHSISYAMVGYYTAYCKTHFPLQFYTSYLRGAIWKQKPLEEIKTLVNDAKKQDIYVLPPDIRNLKEEFYIENKNIRFGISEIKNIGTSAVETILRHLQSVVEKLEKPITEWKWTEFLVFCSQDINNSAYEALISCGACDCFGIGRRRMIYELKIYNMLSPGERKWIQDNFKEIKGDTLVDILQFCGKVKKEGGGCHNQGRADKLLKLKGELETPPHSTLDNVLTIAQDEEKYLGIALTVSKVDGRADAEKATHTIKDFIGCRDKYGILAVEVGEIKIIHTKKGKNPGQEMAFVNISDNSGSIDGAVCFPNVFAENGELLYEANTLLMQVERNTTQEGFIINKLWQI